MSLQAQFGLATLQGPRERNEDFARIVTPEGEAGVTHGWLLALADGVSGGSHGKEAAEAVVRNLSSDYYATPETWEVPYALDKVLGAINSWLHGQIASRREPGGMATTLTALVLRRRRYWLAHVGDSRAYLWRNGQLQQLSTDHVWDNPDMSHVLKRAMGLDQHINVDYSDGELLPGDLFVLLCDGVWEPLGEPRLLQLLQAGLEPQALANALVEQAIAGGGRDNATVVAARIDSVPQEDGLTRVEELAVLPVPKKLPSGAWLDNYEIVELVHESRATLIYRARDRHSGQQVAIKTLNGLLAHDKAAAAALLQEEWLTRRVQSHYFPQGVQEYAGGRSYLYYAMNWYDGATLQQQLDNGAHFTPADVAWMGIRLCKGLAALHRLQVLHRDIKPANVHQGRDGKLHILDLGVAVAAAEEAGAHMPGTPSFMAPELLAGERASEASEVYALGVTLYHLLTRKYPYGEIEPFQRPRFGEPAAPSRYRPDLPAWLENLLLRAVCADREQRFSTMDEMRLALERGEARPVSPPRPAPLAERNPLVLWQAIALLSMLLNMLLLYLFAIS